MISIKKFELIIGFPQIRHLGKTTGICLDNSIFSFISLEELKFLMKKARNNDGEYKTTVSFEDDSIFNNAEYMRVTVTDELGQLDYIDLSFRRDE